MDDALKIDAVRGYLTGEFPGCTVRDFPDRNDHSFVVEKGKSKYFATVSREILDAYPSAELPAQLAGSRLAEVLRKVPGFRITVNRMGCIFDSLPRGIFCKTTEPCESSGETV